MSQLSSRITRALATAIVVTAVVAACGSENGSSFNEDGGASGASGASGGSNGNSSNGGSNGSIGGDDDGGSSGTSGTSGTTSSGSDPNCKKKTCADLNIECGKAGDGCGGTIECVPPGGKDPLDCGDGKRCGSTDNPSHCVTIEVATNCTPKTCADQNVQCGQTGDGCGNTITCGTGPNNGCQADEQCGATGHPSECVKVTASGSDGGACVKKTVADYATQNMDCGKQSDGCGGTIDLPACKTGEFCGNGGPSKCGLPGGGKCEDRKKTCADYPSDICGKQPDGCGGLTADCGKCTLPEVCGGGGVPSHCGGGVLTDDAGNACVPRTKTACGTGLCGTIPDGCGGVVDCGTTNCKNGDLCGGGGTANQCGQPTCVATIKSVACNGKNCGFVGDGCGNIYDCTVGTGCTAPAICGGGGQANVCGGGVPTADGGAGGGTCIPKTSAACTGKQCGPFADGCGKVYTCPACTVSGESCGGGGQASTCGTPQCTPKTQDQACGAKTDPNRLNCGVVADGCGGVVNCWRNLNDDFDAATTACPDPGRAPTFNTKDTCGGGGAANKCGGGVACVGTYCGKQPTCTAAQNGGHGTTISGTVYAPNQNLPIHDAIVYVPNQKLDDVPVGISGCDSCVAPSGSPFVSVHTTTTGAFRLDNVPVPANNKVTLVIQKGRWRKVLQDVTVSACANVNLSKADSSFGATQTDTTGNAAATHIPSNNIPKFAVTTGGYDALQCLIRRIGIADSEFGNPGSVNPSTSLPRRVNLFHGAGTSTSRYRYNLNGFTSNGDRNFPEETTGLYGNASASTADTSKLRGYDGIVLTCTGVGDQNTPYPYAGYYDDMQNFVDHGGKVFASHWHHTWLHRGPNPWNGVAAFSDNNADSSGNGVTEYINQSVQKGQDLASWLNAARGGGTLGQLSVIGSADTIGAPLVSGTSLITKQPNNSGSIQYADFLMPPNATPENKCGRFVMSDLHVTAASGDRRDNGNQSRCIAGSAGSLGNTCTRNSNCGTGGDCDSSGGGFPDNCTTSTNLTDQERILAYMIFDLTSCVPNDPPPQTCTKKTCANYTGVCGVQSDGCGGFTDFCNPCTKPGESCGGGGKAGECGQIKCTPITCTSGCSLTGIPDGCGGLAQCPACPNGTTCGGGGQANVCGTPSCTKLKCGDPGVIQCGKTGDGCGGQLDCTCPAGQTCGLGGANKCGKCTPITTCPSDPVTGVRNCGLYPDGCGGTINCGTCTGGDVCGGGGKANQCGHGSCQAKSCVDLGAQCGQAGDGCGGTQTCPNCSADEFCNASNLCVPPTCQPLTCADQKVECGPVSDGCGGLAKNAAGVAGDCGTCPTGQACGANGQAGKCGTLACNPLSCADVGAVCGQVANGCGGLTEQCGPACPGTKSCVNGACVVACTPTSCANSGAECGVIADGCGGTTDCGTCSPGLTCGFNGQANKCGASGPK